MLPLFFAVIALLAFFVLIILPLMALWHIHNLVSLKIRVFLFRLFKYELLTDEERLTLGYRYKKDNLPRLRYVEEQKKQWAKEEEERQRDYEMNRSNREMAQLVAGIKADAQAMVRRRR